jgi:hypothetical protein
MTTVTKADLVKRLNRLACLANGLPIGLHCWPRGEHWMVDEDGRRHPHPNWFGIGPIAWGDDNTPPAWFDLRLNDTDREYREVNRILYEACKEVGLAFINMA